MVGSLTELFACVDASYAVHDDRKSHGTGGAMSFGCSVFGTKSTKLIGGQTV